MSEQPTADQLLDGLRYCIRKMDPDHVAHEYMTKAVEEIERLRQMVTTFSAHADEAIGYAEEAVARLPKAPDAPSSNDRCHHLYQAHIRWLFGRCLTCEIERLQADAAHREKWLAQFDLTPKGAGLPPSAALLKSDTNHLRDAIAWLTGIRPLGNAPQQPNLNLTIRRLESMLVRIASTKAESPKPPHLREPPHCSTCECGVAATKDQQPTLTLLPQERHALWNCVQAARDGFAWTDPTGRQLLADLYERSAVTKPAVLVKNGYCTDCGGINEHYDHCLTKTGAVETRAAPDNSWYGGKVDEQFIKTVVAPYIRSEAGKRSTLPRIDSELLQEWSGVSIDLIERTEEGYQWTGDAYDFAALVLERASQSESAQ